MYSFGTSMKTKILCKTFLMFFYHQNRENKDLVTNFVQYKIAILKYLRVANKREGFIVSLDLILVVVYMTDKNKPKDKIADAATAAVDQFIKKF